ncbi:hypothetical protein JTB14_018626 [Gonioctena quinquepunctata]|nr:hypothetical protein JTB14_018626 [Gonioctena quinquepunctata]
MPLRFVLLLLWSSVGSFGYHLNLDPSVAAASSWEHVFANNISSVIPLYHYKQKSYFMAIHAKATYMQAMQFCENLHMKLLSIRSADENQRIHKYIRDTNSGNEYWTSGSKLLDGTNWIWMSYGMNVGYTKWASGHPSDAQALCLGLQSEDKTVYWKDKQCGTPLPFICERYRNDGYESNLTDEIGNEQPQTQITRWMNLLESASPSIGLLQFEDKKYFFPRSFKANYMQAIQFCKMIKMELVTISSEEENSRISKYIRDTNGAENWWTSGSRLLDGKTWLWMTRGTAVEYTNWLPGQPGNGNQLCLQLVHQKDKGLFWNDNFCNNQYNIICERSSTDPIDGYWENSVGTRRRPDIDVRYNQDVEDNNWMSRIQKTEPGSIIHSYVEGKKYHIEVDLVATKSQAARFCEFHNMQLITVDDPKESDLIKRVLLDSTASGPFWTSAEKKSSTWTWSSTGERLSYFNWERNQPSGTPDRTCIEVNEDAEWCDQNCAEKRYFICEEPEAIQTNYRVSGGQCNAQPVVKVYISNNVITEEGKTTASEILSTSEDVDANGGYHVEVQNNIDTSNKKVATEKPNIYNPLYIHPQQQ